MKIGLLVIDLQEGFSPSKNLIRKLEEAIKFYDEVVFTKFTNAPNSLFRKQLGWAGDGGDICLPTSGKMILEKMGYGLTADNLEILSDLGCSEWHLVGLETDACVMACAFNLFDAGIPFKIVADACESPFHKQALPMLAKQFGQPVVLERKLK